ncbi:MAG: MazG nucleotide pyrophosphohydrolase domain-containing protein [Bdellovibrionales bacterium]
MSKNPSILDKAIDVGLRDREIFDWPNAQGAFQKLKEEVSELEEVLSQNGSGKTFEEFSDVFFTLLQVARHLKISPEKNLEFALEKYNLRYNEMFKLIEADKKQASELHLDQLENYWQKSKLSTNENLQKLLAQYL